MYPDDAQWGLVEHLLAANLDALNVANWQRAGGKKRDRPRPIPRPGVGADRTTYGKDALPLDEFDAWLAGRAA